MKVVGDCKVVAGEDVGMEHQMVVCRMALDIKKSNQVKAEPRIK